MQSWGTFHHVLPVHLALVGQQVLLRPGSILYRFWGKPWCHLSSWRRALSYLFMSGFPCIGGFCLLLSNESPLSKGSQSKMLLTAWPLSFLEMVLGLFPDKRRFQQFSFIWKKSRRFKTMWFLWVSQKLAAGTDPNWSPERKKRVSACVLQCVWQGPAGQQTHVPHFLQEQPGNNETVHTSLSAQHKQDQTRVQRAMLPMGQREPCPGVWVWRQVLGGQVSSSWFLLMLLGILRNLGQSRERLEK